MKRPTILIAGASLLASSAIAGSISNVPGSLDATIVDPAPALYPHFICASGCSSGSNLGGAVSQSGPWSVGVSNFPAVQPVSGSIAISNLPTTQPVSGSVTVPGIATSANQPAINGDGGGLAHVTNFPTTQQISAADGSDATLGGKSDPQCTNASGPCTAIALLKAMFVASSGPIPAQSSSVSIGGVGLLAGTAKVGQVGVDQTTPGTTNAVQQVALAPVYSTAYEACHVLKASAALVFSLSGVAGQAEYIMLFNATSAPADGALTGSSAPVWQGQTGSGGSWGVSFANPESLSAGAVLCYSSTGGFTKTAISTNNTISGQVQ